MKKIYIYIGGVVLVLIVLYFAFFYQKGTPTAEAVEKNLKDVNNPYNHTTADETEPTRNDGTTKTKISQENFNLRVKRVAEGALAGNPTEVWVAENAFNAMEKNWTPQFGMEQEEAIFYSAREFIDDNYYY